MRYRSKVDTWLVAVVAGAVALPLTIGIVSYLRKGPSSDTWLPLSIALLIVIIICLLAVPVRYDLTADRLLIRSGILHWEVPLADIISITPTSNPLSGPAWSRERIEVTWMRRGNARSILISPERRAEFLREVAGRRGTLDFANRESRGPK